VVSLTVQTVDGLAVKLTVSPEEAVAVSVSVEPTVSAGTAPKVIVCASPPMLNVTVTAVAAAKDELPACDAVTLHVPIATAVSVLPFTVQMDAEFET
jgi:hypothetical protein